MSRMRQLTKVIFAGICLTANAVNAENFQSLDEIRLAAKQFARERAGSVGPNSAIEAGRLDERLRLHQCGTSLSTGALGRRVNSSNITVIVKCDDEIKPWTVYVPVKVINLVKVAVAKRPLARGIPVTAEDITLEEREVSRLTGGYFENPSALIGRPAKRLIPMGATVSPRDLDIQKVISKGSRISIVAETHGITVRMPGRALEDAGKGDQIQVENLSSNRKIVGTVLGPGIVKVMM